MKASPWSKYFCASGLDVATDRVCTPRPVYWMTLDWDAPSGPVGSLSTELGPTAIAAESPINMRMFVNRKMRPPFIFVSSLVTNGIGVLLFVIRVAWVIRHAPQLPSACQKVGWPFAPAGKKPAGAPTATPSK